MKELKDLKILYVEDDEDIREEVFELLTLFFQDIISAQNGEEGLHIFKTENPDIVVTDIQMPKMNGIKMIEKIREVDENIHIIITTAYSEAEHLFKAISLGVNDYLVKPMNPKNLIEKLTQYGEKKIQSKKLAETVKLLEEYKNAVDESSLVTKTDLLGIITYANRAFCQVSGYREEEIIGKPHSVIRHESMPDCLFKDLWETINEKKVWKGTITNKKKSGESYIAESVVKPILDENDEIKEFIAIRTDVTERETYKDIIEHQLDISIDSLSDSMQKIKEYEKAIDAANAYIKINAQGIVTFSNESFYLATGYSNEELIGNSYHHFHNKENCYCMEGIQEAVEKKEIVKHQVRIFDKQNRLKHFYATHVPILSLDGETTELMSFHHDITQVVELAQEIEETQKEIVYHLGELVEARSKETGLHVKRVALYSELLAKAYGLSEKEVELIKMASPMHDIGKVSIPDSILQKPDKLTQEEFEVIKTHSSVGHEVFKNSHKEILQAVAIIARDHHEKYNGKGYPSGRSKEDIHIFGRIVSVADVFDALAHDRVYKKAWPLEKILDLFKEERGESFDPKIVDLFFENLNDILKIQKKLFDGSKV